jgi:hypothetical protein
MAFPWGHHKEAPESSGAFQFLYLQYHNNLQKTCLRPMAGMAFLWGQRTKAPEYSGVSILGLKFSSAGFSSTPVDSPFKSHYTFSFSQVTRAGGMSRVTGLFRKKARSRLQTTKRWSLIHFISSVLRGSI